MEPSRLEDLAGDYDQWEATLQSILAAGGRTMVLGAMDVGKTTFTRRLVCRAAAAGRGCAVIDADPGQSEIGPPGCIGLAFADSGAAAQSELAPSALAFVGGVSPAGHVLEYVTGIRRLADQAGDVFVVLDTSGYVHGPGARRMIQSLGDLFIPNNIVALQRDDSLSAVLAPWRRSSMCTVYTLGVPDCIGAKPPGLRAQRRAMKFAAYFNDARTAQYAFADTALVGTWLGGGTPVAAHILKYLNQALGPLARIYHAELTGRHLGIMVSRPLSQHGTDMGVALAQLGANEVTATVAPRLRNLLVGLESPNGKMIGMGLITSLDFRRGHIGILTPARSPDAATTLRFGSQRVSPDGSDCGALKAGEL